MIDLFPFLTGNETYEAALRKYIAALLAAGPASRNMAIVLQEYNHKESKSFVNFVEKQEEQISDILKKIVPVNYCVYGRKKSLYSYCEKLKKANDVRDVKDIYAIRVVLDDSTIGVENAIEFCYIIAKTLIDYYQSKNFTVDFLTEKSSGKLDDNVQIYVPKTEDVLRIISPDYQSYIKDYISKPKSNGYQSIHIRAQQNGKSVDIQVRTSTMHEYSEYGGASHDKIYKPPISSDLLKQIHMEGLSYTENGITEDKFGLFRPLPIGTRTL